MALFHDPLWLIPFSVFLGGLVGSPHCMSMCGPIVLNFAREKSQLFAYQMGRMTSYCLTGALSGAFGEAILGSERPKWLSGMSLLFIAALLLLNGYRAIAGKPLHFPVPIFFSNVSKKVWRGLRFSSLPPKLTALAAGIFTVFLPCGHLYSFLIGAVATGSAIKGAGFMFAFWLGSAPLLSFGGVWLQQLFKSRIVNSQRWAGILLVVAGLFSVLNFGARTESFLSLTSVLHPQQSKASAPLICH